MVLNIIIIVKSILNYCQKMDILLIVECGLFYTHKLVMWLHYML